MIVSASRRTDVPALYGEWLDRRLEAGYARVRNPFDPRAVRRVDLRPPPRGQLDALVLWTRDPGPCLGRVGRWEDRGVRTLWLVTVTGYPRELEPAAPPWQRAADAIRALAGRIGADRVAWRYDPVLIAPGRGVDAAFHRRRFAAVARAVEGAVGRCIVSVYDPYKAPGARLRRAGWPRDPSDGAAAVCEQLAAVAADHGIPLHSCCEDLVARGIAPGACIDAALLARLWGIPWDGRPDPGQRPGCRCARSVDLGAYDTCTHGCLYCYATRSAVRAARRRAEHDPAAETLDRA